MLDFHEMFVKYVSTNKPPGLLSQIVQIKLSMQNSILLTETVHSYSIDQWSSQNTWNKP